MAEVLPDLLADGLAVVFCGTAASSVSAREGAYYANPGNCFWRALHEIGMTSRLFSPREYPCLLGLGIGLTDLAKGAAGSDRDLSPEDYAPALLREKIARYRPMILAFTSKTAWRVWRNAGADVRVDYGLREDTMVGAREYVLPSPSGAARRYWDVGPWLALSKAYRREMELG